MFAHLRANLWLLGLSVVLCCGIYPLALVTVGQALFPFQANGSLVIDATGSLRGSMLIAQEFKGDEFFQPRPSAVSYNAAASGGSNWGANNYLLRDRVARALGPIVKYKSGLQKGQEVGPAIVKWFRETPNVVGMWASAHTTLAQNWVKSDDVAKGFVKAWFEKHPDRMAAWKTEHPGQDDPTPEDLAVPFFVSFAKEHPGAWLTIVENANKKNEPGEPIKVVQLVSKDSEDSADIRSVFFDMWRQAHPHVEMQEVPADMVMASASGLDPHITLDNAMYQLERVAKKWAQTLQRDPDAVANEIDLLIRAQASAPLYGLVGVPMINVFETNRMLQAKYRTIQN